MKLFIHLLLKLLTNWYFEMEDEDFNPLVIAYITKVSKLNIINTTRK